MNRHSSEAAFQDGGYEHDGAASHGFWSRAAEEALGAGVMIGAALAIDALERPWRERRTREHEGAAGGGGVLGPAHESYFGSPRFLWTSIGALALMSRARRDAAGLRTAAKLALAVGCAQGLARATRSWVHRTPAATGRRVFSERSAAAWAAAGVLERDQGKGPGLAAYSAAALAGYPRPAGRKRPVADAVLGAVVGRLIGRLVGQIRLA